jgi:hypothetical protein
MDSQDKIYRLQAKLLNEIEQERQAIEKGMQTLGRTTKRTPLRKRRKRRRRSKRISSKSKKTTPHK